MLYTVLLAGWRDAMDEDELDDFEDDDLDLIDDRLECPRCGLTDDLCECES
jgi:hypothetical protein